MCGICGKIYFDRQRRVDSALVSDMTEILTHRGPDDSGLYIDRHVGLGHRRLRIIDLSPAARQPMSNEDGTVRIVFNGEIYNFEQLRAELEGRGHRFRSHSDTEVIVHLYEEQGPGCVRDLRGMFAFAIWDAVRQQLVLARDRAGKKPLVYALADGALLFASEIKALLQDPSIHTEVNAEALHHYLTYQYVPGPATAFQGIMKLPPAHVLVLRDGKTTLERYWDISYREKLRLAGPDDCRRRFLDVFRDAVKIRLRSDVPLGAFLSGGLDSSATVAVMSTLMNRPVKTFSIGFEEADFNELRYARAVADMFQTDHTEFVVKPDAIEVLPKIVWHYDEPYADPSAIPTYYVARLTREHVTVALNGDGGDELFAGYERYVADRLARWYLKVPAVLREHVVRRIVDRLPYREYRWSPVRRLKRFVNGLADDPAGRYVQWLCYFNNRMKSQLYSEAFAGRVDGCDSVDLLAAAYSACDSESPLEKNLYADLMLYLPYDLLAKVDIASMAHSLEARSPFLDQRVMEFAACLTPRMKLRGMQTKHILKKAFKGVLPKQILYRRKMGFGVPLHRWFQNELKPVVHEIILARRTLERGYFKRAAVQALVDEHMQQRADHSYRLWALLYLELWHRMFVDKSRVLGL